MKKYIIDFDPKVCVQRPDNFTPQYILLNPLDYLHGNDLIIPDGIRMPNGDIIYDFWFDNLDIIKSFLDHSQSIDMYIGDSLLHAFENYNLRFITWNEIERFLQIIGIKNIYFHNGNVLKGEFCEIRSENGIIYCHEDQLLIPPLNKYAQELPLQEKDKGMYKISEDRSIEVEGIKDMFGGLYSCDGKKFIKWLGSDHIYSYRIKDGVEEICDDAFNVMTGMGMGVMGLYINTIIIPEGVKRIGDRAFFGSTLNSVEFPTSLEFIGERAFVAHTHSYGLDSIYIPENVKYIGKYCFNNHLKISKIKVSPENKWYCSEDNALYNKEKTELIKVSEIRKLALGEIVDTSDDYTPGYAEGYTARREFVIPDSVQIIKSGAFNHCSIKRLILHDNIRIIEDNGIDGGFDYLYIGANIRHISENFFMFNCRQIEIEVSSKNQWFCVEDGVLYNKDKTVLMYCPPCKESFYIPETVGVIGNYAFAGCRMKNIILPSSVTILGDSAFYMSELSEISLSQNLCFIGSQVLCSCSKLRKIIIPKGTETKYMQKYHQELLDENYSEEFEGFFVDDTRQKAEFKDLPKIEDLHTEDGSIYYIPSGTWDYYSHIFESKEEDSDDEWDGYLVEISKEVIISHLNDLKNLLCSILTQGDGLKCYERKLLAINPSDSTINVASLRFNNNYWIFLKSQDHVKTSYGYLGDILLLLGFDYDEYLRSRDNVLEYKICDKDFSCCMGRVLAKPIIMEWDEDFVDEDTGDIVTVTRSEEILPYGSYMNENVIDILKELDGIKSVFVFFNGNDIKNYKVLDKVSYSTSADVLPSLYENIYGDVYPTDIEPAEVLQKVLHEITPNFSEGIVSETVINSFKEDLINIGLEISEQYFDGYIRSGLSCIQEAEDAENIDNMIQKVKECVIDFFDRKIKNFSAMDKAEVYENFITDDEQKSLLIGEMNKCDIPQSIKRQVEGIISVII